MKKIISFLILLIISGVARGQLSVSPSTFDVDEQVTITIDINSDETDCNGFNNPSSVYMHSGAGDNDDAFGFDVVGNWGQDDGVGEMVSIGGGLYSISITPSNYYDLTPQEIDDVTQLGMVFRNEDGTQEFKDNGCSDFFVPVGSFQLFLDSSIQGQNIVSQGTNLTISATTSVSANFELFANGASIDDTQSGTSFSTNYTVNENTYFELVATQVNDNATQSKTFSAISAATVNNAPLPSSDLKDGINYIDDNTAILVLYAPGKDYVYVAGSFNNYQPSQSDAMNRDTSEDRFWIQIDGLTPGQKETYQYWVGDTSPLPDSPELVKVADPYSHLILSSFDDEFIPDSTYPNLPDFPEGAEFEVTVLETGQTPYNWQVTDFQKPKKEDLIIYEVLVRDFDEDRNYQDLIDKIDYFKNLNINAIHLMPVMEFEGNESWGYNTSYHMALDKFYGTEDKLKEFIDLCHQNGIAVILDLVLNHAFGRSPMVRMWMEDPNGDGFGGVSSENPYFNEEPKHSYNVGLDYNHQVPEVQQYTERVIKHWVEEFKIDGFRWDLTKGFTQNCSPNDTGCTNSYQQDRVDVLQDYADYSWSLDDTHYVIFEHLGQDFEEQQWANYRIGEGKGIMLWGKMTDRYNELTMGQNGDKNITRMGHDSRGFQEPRLLGYAESHDEERLMYKNLQFGNTSNPNHNVQNIDVALSRMSALGAISVLVPGPKMIWHFGDLGMDNSIFTCSNGNVNLPGGSDGDCKLDTKPQPQWTENWLSDPIRGQIYEDWSKLHKLKTEEAVFEGDYAITSSSGNFTPRIDIFDNSIPSSELKNVIVLSNFDVSPLNVSTNFPGGVTNTWYDLMDPSGNTTYPNSQSIITLAPGEFLVLGNKASDVLSLEDNVMSDDLALYPNPSADHFSLNTEAHKVEIFNVNGQKVKSFSGRFGMNHKFQIRDLAKGIYFIKVVNNQRVDAIKLIKE
ncbi:MAG: alpha-amylase family glycosyl hydrolase [Psychroflexus sp.]|nr:alpha-amylase family glycosyl hydrolase [Psychroflexus sp.]